MRQRAHEFKKFHIYRMERGILKDLLVPVTLTQSSCEFSDTERHDGGNEEERDTW